MYSGAFHFWRHSAVPVAGLVAARLVRVVLLPRALLGIMTPLHLLLL